MNMAQRNVAFGPPYIAVSMVIDCWRTSRLGVLFPIIEFTFWTVVLRLWLRVLLGSFTLRVLGLRGAICIARVLLRSGLWRTRMARSLAGSRGRGCTGPGIWRGGVLTECWSFWGVRMRR